MLLTEVLLPIDVVAKHKDVEIHVFVTSTVDQFITHTLHLCC